MLQIFCQQCDVVNSKFIFLIVRDEAKTPSNVIYCNMLIVIRQMTAQTWRQFPFQDRWEKCKRLRHFIRGFVFS